jgi:hypothetical protein
MNESPTPTKTKRLPRYEGGSRPRAAEDFQTPIPKRLAAAMLAADVPEAARHAELAGHFEKARSEAIAVATKLEQTKRDDEKRRVEALGFGKPSPSPRSEKIELELRQRRDDVRLLAELLRSSADELLLASVPFVADALTQAEREAEEAVEEVQRLLEAVRAALEEADRLGGEVGWLASLLRSGVVFPFREGTRARVLPSVRQAIGNAIAGLQEDLIRRDENVEKREREEAVEMKRLPLGASIFKEGKEFRVVDDRGTLEEVER